MAINYVKVGKEIKRIRKEKGWTQAYLAEMVDISDQYISAIENASKCASLQVIFNLAEVLDISLDILFGIRKRNHSEYSTKADRLLEDCSIYEEEFLIQVLEAVKLLLRENIYFNNR